MVDPIAGYDEDAYLQANPDVRAKVAKVAGFTGWQHLIEHGYRENRRGVAPEVMKAVQARRGYDPAKEVPPAHLRRRVHGADDVESFEALGRTLAANVFGELIRGFPWVIDGKRNADILDFGCGSGRVIKHLHGLCATTRIGSDSLIWHGSDIDPEAVRWCQQHLATIGDFAVNDAKPPLPYKDNSFDFIYGVSVFTHLPEDIQLEWLAELRRVTRQNGLVLLSTHGEGLFNGSEEQRKAFEATGFYHRQAPTEFAASYGTTYHSRGYIERVWREFFVVRKIVGRGIAGRQDLVLCERSSWA